MNQNSASVLISRSSVTLHTVRFQGSFFSFLFIRVPFLPSTADPGSGPTKAGTFFCRSQLAAFFRIR